MIGPLQSEGQSSAGRRRSTGDQVSYRSYDGMRHEFFGTAKVGRKAYQANQDAADPLKAALVLAPMSR